MQAPGPSTLRFILLVRRRGFLDAVGELWREHGDVFQVRIGSRTLLFAVHPDAVEYINLTARDRFGKGSSFDAVRRYLTGEGLVGSTGELWRRQRKLMSPFFTPRGVRAYAELMLRDAEQLLERWRGLAMEDREVEISEEMTAITASIILKSMFGAASLESIDQLQNSVETMIGFVARKSNGFTLPTWVPTAGNRKYFAARARVHRLIAEIIAKRRASREAEWPDDLLTRLMRARDEDTGKAMSDTLLRDESITVFFAGHETTARTMTFAWYALAKNPQVATQLHGELDRVLNGRLPTADDLRELPYTLRVVKEVMRLYPAAPFYSRDAFGLERIGRFDVPEGTTVLLTPYYTHRHPEFWHEPEVFNPDRWQRERDFHTGAFHPFAIGPRTCLGNHFSLLESQLLLAVLAQRFAPRVRQSYQARWQMNGTLGLASGLPMVISAR